MLFFFPSTVKIAFYHPPGLFSLVIKSCFLRRSVKKKSQGDYFERQLCLSNDNKYNYAPSQWDRDGWASLGLFLKILKITLLKHGGYKVAHDWAIQYIVLFTRAYFLPSMFLVSLSLSPMPASGTDIFTYLFSLPFILFIPFLYCVFGEGVSRIYS